MKRCYSIREAKARLAEILRLVAQRRRVTITDRGRPVAHVVPADALVTLADRIEDLTARGVLTGQPAGKPTNIRPIARRPGALERFLRERSR